MFNRTKIAILSTISNTIWFILIFLWKHPGLASLEGEELGRAWGIYFLVLVAGFIVLDVIGASIIMTKEKRSGGQGFEERTDERDQQIEAFAMKNLARFFFFFFLVSLTLLGLGIGLHVFFSALAFALLFSVLAMWISYIIAYERGL